jgi:hypothetical protein
MTAAERRAMGYAPELAVIFVLRAAAEASYLSLATAHHLSELDPPQSREQDLAQRLCAALGTLEAVATAYCDHVVELAQPAPQDVQDIAF